LDRALVAGLLLELTLQGQPLPASPECRRRHLKARLAYSLATQLAGRISLDRFRTLIRRLEQWFPYYYPLLPLPPPEAESSPSPGRAGCLSVSAPRLPNLARPDLLQDWLQTAAGDILPSRPQGKFRSQGLQEFLQRSRGRWFRLKDLARFFHIDRKTAWEYVQKLQNAGLLVHNRGRSAAARYRLADDFLKIRLTALQARVVQALTGWSHALVETTIGWLTASAGEPFWEEPWPWSLPAGRRPELLDSLQTAGLLVVMGQSGRQRLLRLHQQWLQPRKGPDSSGPASH